MDFAHLIIQKFHECPNCKKQGLKGAGFLGGQVLLECSLCEHSEWRAV